MNSNSPASSSPKFARPWTWGAQLVVLALILGLCSALALQWGAVPISAKNLWHLITGQAVDPSVRMIVLDLRWPRLLLALAAGSGLAASGVAWQGVLRNPLADPYLLGVSAGGALGAAFAIAFDLSGPGGISLVPPLAFFGSLGAVAVVYALGNAQGLKVERLLLTGVALSSFLSALLAVLLTQRPDKLPSIYFWLMGSLAPPRGLDDLLRSAPYLMGGLATLIVFASRLNVMQLGPDRARSLGVDPNRTQIIVIGAASLVTASVVSICGMIGFVGLVVPHMTRYLVGPDLRRVLPTSALIGATLLVCADVFARLAGEIPIGVVTSFLGAPFFLLLVMRNAES